MDGAAKAVAAVVDATATAIRHATAAATPRRAMAMATPKAVAAATSDLNATQKVAPRAARLKPAHRATLSVRTTAKAVTAVAEPRARATPHRCRQTRLDRTRAASAHRGVSAASAVKATRRDRPTATAAASANRAATGVNVHPAHRSSSSLHRRPISWTPRHWPPCPIWTFQAMSTPLLQPPYPRVKPSAARATAMAVTATNVVNAVNVVAVARSARRQHSQRSQLTTAPPLTCSTSSRPQTALIRKPRPHHASRRQCSKHRKSPQSQHVAATLLLHPLPLWRLRPLRRKSNPSPRLRTRPPYPRRLFLQHPLHTLQHLRWR